VPVIINGAIKLDFVVDSGASDVSIPADVVLTLIRARTITDDDFIGDRVYQTADGRSVPSKVFKIRSLRVGDRVLQDVTASVADISAPLLLGQSFLSRFRSWSIDNERQVLVLQ
jgi:clan AA aspartic protease (TIGR02281 family)